LVDISVADPFDTDTDPAFHFDTDPDPAFNLIRIRIGLLDTDPDPYRLKAVMYLKRNFFYTSLLDFPCQ
jgi:hypothetical protein